MLKTIKKYVYEKLHAYHLKRSNYCYSKLDEWDADNLRYWGEKTAKHTRKCLKFNAKLRELELGES